MNMHKDDQWFSRQTKLAASETAKWPEWMKKEAGIGQGTNTSSTTPTSTEQTRSTTEPMSAPPKG
jgi:hypothetical protein